MGLWKRGKGNDGRRCSRETLRQRIACKNDSGTGILIVNFSPYHITSCSIFSCLVAYQLTDSITITTVQKTRKE